jgi:hypothetical protein
MDQSLRGFVGQSMNGARNRRVIPHRILDASSGSGSITVTRPCVALIFVFGGCGSGRHQNGGSCLGGAGGGAAYKWAELGAGQTLSYAVGAGGAGVTENPGNPGGDSTVTLPNGHVVRASGGQGGPLTPGQALAGVGTGGDVNRRGGNGGADSSSSGFDGEDGGATGSANGAPGVGGAGGQAGLVSVMLNAANTSARGSQGNTSPSGPSADGSAGRVLILFIEVPA